MAPSGHTDAELIARARTLADEVLFAQALDVDRSSEIPTAPLQALADAGIYGASVHAAPETVVQLLEILASGCLTTAFVWAQHLGASAGAHYTEGPAHRFADDLAAGRLRGGVAFAHMLRPDPPLTTATPVEGGWLFRGRAPWVTGWGHIDLVHAAARHGDDIVWGLIDATSSDTLRHVELDLAVMAATRTVELDYDDHFVAADRVTRIENHGEWRKVYRTRLRSNGSLPLGVAARCCRLLERNEFDAQLARLRERLDEADPDNIAAARSAAALFAVRAATALVASSGGLAVTLGHHAQRLHREAMFLLVQGQTPQIRAEMLDSLSGQYG